MQQDGVPGPLSRCLLCGKRSGGIQDPQVGEDQGEEDTGEVDDVKDQAFGGQDGVLKDVLPQAEDRQVEEAQRLGGQRDKEVGDVRRDRDEPDQADDHVGAAGSADLRVSQGLTDGDVTFHGHAGQADWRVPGGEDSHQDEGAAHGHVDLVQDVAEHKEGDGDCQL